MPVKSSKEPNQSASAEDQRGRFIETARQLGADEDTERFEAKLKRIATAKPPQPKLEKK